VGFPKLLWFGREADFNLMVVELLGENLEDLMKVMNGRRFSLPTVINIADQLVFDNLMSKNNRCFIIL
jgi:casein kinase 1 epsilon